MLWEKIWLASNSPRRRELFSWMGLEHEIHPAEINETPIKDEVPTKYVLRLAQQKAIAIGEGAPANFFLFSADTIVVYEGAILGKPSDDEHAKQILMDLQGNSHQVRTAVAIYLPDQQKLCMDLCCSNVQMRNYSQEEVDAYVATGDPLDKAGAYGIQGIGGCLVQRIEGSYSNVVGLPLCETVELLRRHRVADPF